MPVSGLVHFGANCLLLIFVFELKMLLLVNWEHMEYNYGDCFDGSVFTAPVDGIYTFNATAFHDSDSCDGKITIKENYEDAAIFSRFVPTEDNIPGASLTVQASLELDKNATVTIELYGEFKYLNDYSLTYFEGRLLASHSK